MISDSDPQNPHEPARVTAFRRKPSDAHKLRSAPDCDEAVVVVDLAPLVEPGLYQLAFVEHRTALIFQKAAKVAITFQIIDQGKFYGINLDRWYNVKRLIGKPAKGGKFQVGAHCDFLREYLTLFPDAADRLDRVSFAPFRRNVIRGRVETVTQNAKQQALPGAMQYSIVRELLGTGA